MVKIVSGWSNRGGSTFAFINLTNALNAAGYDTTFYGPHEWHLDKCKSGRMNEINMSKDDNMIFHFIPLNGRPDVRKVLLSCHEKNIFEVGDIPQYWDEVVFLNKKQREYHNRYKGRYNIIPNLKEVLENNPKSPETKGVAGIIGSIDENKQTHISIQKAVKDGFNKIMLFGNVTDPNYYNNFVKPLIDEKVIERGFISDKQKIYDEVEAVYLSSNSEVASLVKDECETTGTKFYGSKATEHDVINLSNDEIIKEWVKVLDL
tara:strand:+ start:773 stop:1558 length:786 start_codon:yes stop_codon:yes gene_type:complete